MTGDEFASLLNEFTLSAESGDGARFAGHFTEDAHLLRLHLRPAHGRADIAHMMQNLFHRDADGLSLGNVRSGVRRQHGLCRGRCRVSPRTIPQFKGQRVVIDGMSRFIVRDGLIAEYRESVNGGVAMAQLGVEPERMAKVFQALDRMAQGAAGNHGLSGAAEEVRARETLNVISTTRCAATDGEHRRSRVSYQHILYEVSEKIATITLNRPDRHERVDADHGARRAPCHGSRGRG